MTQTEQWLMLLGCGTGVFLLVYFWKRIKRFVRKIFISEG